MTWDPDRYTEEVLEPARAAGDIPPPDLYVRYGLSPTATDPAVFGRQVSDVVAHWHRLTGRRTYARLAEALLAAHHDLEQGGQLTPGRFAAYQEKTRGELLSRLGQLAKGEAGVATHVGPETVTKLRDAMDGAVTEADVASALSQAGVRIVTAFPELPASRHPKQPDLARYLRQLNQRLSAVVVFGDAARRGVHVLGGLRLADGRRLDSAAIEAAQQRVSALPHTDPAKTPSENVLAILLAASRKPPELDWLILSEVVEDCLRRYPPSQFTQRVIALQAREVLGLDEEDAGLIAGALSTAKTSGSHRQEVEQALSAGQLRAAEKAMAGLPADDPLRGRVTERAEQVSALSREAGQEMSQGRREAAARLLAQAISLATDDPELTRRLAEIPPPAPRQAQAQVNGDHVLISWQASPTSTGEVRYRVVRGLSRAPASPAEGVTVAETGRPHADDREVKPGSDLYYSIFASRGADVWSAPAVPRPVPFAPDVAGVSVTRSETSVAAVWQAHPGAASVQIVRRDDRPPQDASDGTEVPGSRTGFSDQGLHTGTKYYYRITVTYQAPSGPRQSPGLLLDAVPEPEPEPVTDLAVSEADGGRPGAFRASWTSPRWGRAQLTRSSQLLSSASGGPLAPADRDLLQLVPGEPRPGAGGRVTVDLTVAPGRHYFTVLTDSSDASVLGNIVPVQVVEPVSDLTADRMHDDVRLAWVWPSHATDVLVRWGDHEHRCSRRAYFDEGPPTVLVGRPETTVEARALYPQPGGGSIAAPGVSVRVAARGVAIHYRIRRASRLQRKRRTITFTAEETAQLPGLVVVRSTGRFAPDEPADGDVIHRVEPCPIAPGQPVAVTVDAGRDRGWLACFPDPAAPQNRAADGETGILLFPPPQEEMSLR